MSVLCNFDSKHLLARRVAAPVDTWAATPNNSTTDETYGGRPNQQRHKFLKKNAFSVAEGPGPA